VFWVVRKRSAEPHRRNCIHDAAYAGDFRQRNESVFRGEWRGSELQLKAKEKKEERKSLYTPSTSITFNKDKHSIKSCK